MFYHPTVADNSNTKSEYIFGYIGNAATQAGDHVHIAGRYLCLCTSHTIFQTKPGKERPASQSEVFFRRFPYLTCSSKFKNINVGLLKSEKQSRSR